MIEPTRLFGALQQLSRHAIDPLVLCKQGFRCSGFMATKPPQNGLDGSTKLGKKQIHFDPFLLGESHYPVTPQMSTKAGGAELPNYLKIIKQPDAEFELQLPIHCFAFGVY